MMETDQYGCVFEGCNPASFAHTGFVHNSGFLVDPSYHMPQPL